MYLYNNEEIELLEVEADCSLAVNVSNLEIVSCAIKIAREYNAKKTASNYENYWKASQEFYNNVVLKLKNNEIVPKADAKEALKTWQQVYGMFLEVEISTRIQEV